MLKRVIALSSALWLGCCASRVPIEEASVQALAGRWTFSHIGALRGLPDVKAASASTLQGSEIVIEPDGSARLDLMGNERETTLVFDSDSETQTVFALADGDEFLIYDKASGLLWKSTEVDLGGIRGKMPAHFRKEVTPSEPAPEILSEKASGSSAGAEPEAAPPEDSEAP